METVLLVGLFLGLWDYPHGLGNAECGKGCNSTFSKDAACLKLHKNINTAYKTQNKPKPNKTKPNTNSTSSSKYIKHSTKQPPPNITNKSHDFNKLPPPKNCAFYLWAQWHIGSQPQGIRRCTLCKSQHLFVSCWNVSPPQGRNPKGNEGIPTITFQVRKC